MSTTRIQLESIPSLNEPGKTFLLGYYEQGGTKIASFMEQIGNEQKWRVLPVPDEFRQTAEDIAALEDRILQNGFILLEPRVLSRE